MLTLVTGLDGFTGPYIKSELEKKGHHVAGLIADLTNYEATSEEIKRLQPEAVIHLAGISFVGHDHANSFYDVNLMGTHNLLKALVENVPNVQSILLASSANVYGSRSEGLIDEDARPDPPNDYAVSKLAMEYLAHLWVGRLPLFIVRPFNYTGVGQDEKFLIPKIVSHFKQRKSIIELGNLEVWREFGDVRDVATIYCRLIECCPFGETINVCTGEAHSLREVVLLCQKFSGHEIEIEINPSFVRENEVRILRGNNSRLEKIIGELEVYPLEDTLKWMLNEHRC